MHDDDHIWGSVFFFTTISHRFVLGEPMTGMLDTNAPDNGDAPPMDGTGADYGTDPTSTGWTVPQAPLANPESNEYEQIQPASAVEQFQLYSIEHLKSAAENIDQKTSPSDPVPENSDQVVGQQAESNGEHMDQIAEEDVVKQAGDSESPSNMELEDAPKEETAVAEPGAEPAEDTTTPQEPELPTEYERLSKVVEDNPEDFNGWVYLLQYVEQEVSLTF